MDNPRIYTLKRLVKLMFIVSLLWLVFVMMGFFDSSNTEVNNDIRIPLPRMTMDNPYLIRFDNRQLIVILYSPALKQKLFSNSADSKPHLVAFAYGTDLGCPLEIVEPDRLKESCSNSEYDFAGRPLDKSKGFPELRVPVYTFCTDFSCLNIQP